MSPTQGWNGRVVKTMFVSDVHLGCRHAQADAFLEALNRCEPQELYLVGDFIDGWKLRSKWRWLPVYDQILQRLMAMHRRGAKIYYTPGNHDSFMRSFLSNFGMIDVKDRFIHKAVDGRRYLVTHGDQFDSIEQNCQWLSLVAAFGYDVLLSANWIVNKLRGKKEDPYAFCGVIKRRVKRLVRHVSEFEGKLVDSARAQDCDGIICGHIHAPRIMQVDGLTYCNTGDWVENCSALVEYEDGHFSLIRRHGEVIADLPARRTPTAPPAVAPVAESPAAAPVLAG